MLLTAQAPERPVRPSSVTVAYWLQLAVVVVLLLLIGLVVWHAVQWDGEIDRAARAVPDADPAEVAGERTGNAIMSAVLGGSALLPAIGLAVTAPFVRMGHNAARIVVFVVAGVAALFGIGPGCAGAAVIPFAFLAGPAVAEPPPGAGPDGAWEESRFFTELYGSSDPTEGVFFGGGLLGVATVLVLTLAVVVLLAVPPANRFFVPRPASVQPMSYGPQPAGYAMPAVPPGYMICPDPAVHLAKGQAGAQPSEGTDAPARPPS